MSWEDFLKFMEEHYDSNSWDATYNYVCISSERNPYIKFYKNGDIFVAGPIGDIEDITIAEHRTYEQMLKIIEGLLL